MNSPIAHNQNAVSDRAFQARQKNVLEMLNQIANENKNKPVEQQPNDMYSQPEQPRSVPLAEVKQRVHMDAFDEQGNFKRPPIPGYWLGMLESINQADSTKRGRDWRDDAIDTFRQTRQFLDEMEASLG